MNKTFSLESEFKKLLGSDLENVKSVWSVKPYDEGTLLTSEGEKIVGHGCTSLWVLKVGVKDYRYVAIHGNKKSKYFKYKGYPKKVELEYRDGSKDILSVYRKKYDL